MTYISLDVDVSVDDLIDAMSDSQVKKLVNDPVILLESLVWLRQNGYTVEPKPELYSTPNHQNGGA